MKSIIRQTKLVSPRILYKCWKLGIFLWILKIMAALKAQFKVHNLYTKSTLEQSLIQLKLVLAWVFCLKHCLICWCQHLSIIYYLFTYVVSISGVYLTHPPWPLPAPDVCDSRRVLSDHPRLLHHHLPRLEKVSVTSHI